MRLIIFFILLSLGADAQIIRANGFYRPTGTQFLLDAYPNAAAAYSLRKLKSSYSGSAIRIRRSNDNAEQDIGFIGQDLDTASMKTFVGANSGFVVTWYNQGDSTSIDFSQTTQASQPRIINAGVIERRAGDPTMRFDGSNDFMDVASSTVKFNYLHKAGQSAIFCVIQAGIVDNPSATYVIFDNTTIGTTSVGMSLLFDDAGANNNAIESYITRGSSGTVTADNLANNFYTANSVGLLTNIIDNSNLTAANRNYLYRNGLNEEKNNTSTQTASTANASFNMRLGRRANLTSFNFNGYITELIFYPTNQSSNRTGIETNINNYYGLW